MFKSRFDGPFDWLGAVRLPNPLKGPELVEG